MVKLKSSVRTNSPNRETRNKRAGRDNPPETRPLKIREKLESDPNQPVLFISDPTEGDQFVFGTQEQLNSHEFTSHTEEGFEITDAKDILNRFDLEVYEGNEPTIVQI